MASIRIAILGSGNMGTAMAQVLAKAGHEVVLWDYFSDVVHDIQHLRENRRFLPGVQLHPSISAEAEARKTVSGAAMIVVSVPSSFVIATLEPVIQALTPHAVLLNVAKGFSPGTREPVFFTLERTFQNRECVHLAGPAIANELARGTPTSIVLASSHKSTASRVADWFAGDTLHPETTTDVKGAAFGGILKNTYAILLGCLEGLGGNGRNLEAAALTACLREMVQIARALGAKPDTLYGLAGLGDLLATGLSRDSHNRKLGQRLGSGKNLAELEKELGWLPEGAQATKTICELARSRSVSTPIADWVDRVLSGSAPVLRDLVQAMTLGAARPESDPT